MNCCSPSDEDAPTALWLGSSGVAISMKGPERYFQVRVIRNAGGEPADLGVFIHLMLLFHMVVQAVGLGIISVG